MVTAIKRVTQKALIRVYVLRSIYNIVSVCTQAIALTETMALGIGASSIKLYPIIRHNIDIHGVFFIYTIMGIITAIWGMICIPDNRGKSLVKVEETFEKK